MNTEVVVLLLEERLHDIKEGLVHDLWPGFVAGIERCSVGLKATRQSLEEWTDNVVDLMRGFDYTKGLLAGLSVGVSKQERGMGDWLAVAEPFEPQTTAQSAAQMSREEELVQRIESLVSTARSLA